MFVGVPVNTTQDHAAAIAAAGIICVEGETLKGTGTAPGIFLPGQMGPDGSSVDDGGDATLLIHKVELKMAVGG